MVTTKLFIKKKHFNAVDNPLHFNDIYSSGLRFT